MLMIIIKCLWVIKIIVKKYWFYRPFLCISEKNYNLGMQYTVIPIVTGN